MNLASVFCESELFHPGSWICESELFHPGSWIQGQKDSGSRFFSIPDPGTKGQKITGSRIRIRNTDSTQ
jgi:hypothetical protein